MRYKHYLLLVLLLIYAFNGVERVAFGLLLQDIKSDFQLSDTQLGLLTGIAFALFYSVMGIPLARWADRGNRILIVATTTALWSGAVALCGFAGSFLQLMLIRIGVAVGEAGCLPPANSLIADHFSRAERPRAISIYFLGAPVGVGIGYFCAGWLNELYGWRSTFILLGLPGLLLSALALFTLREPRKQRADGTELSGGTTGPAILDQDTPLVQPDLSEVFRTLWGQKAFRHLLLCFVVAVFFATGIEQWKPAFFIRSYGLQTGELGTWFAVIYGVGGFLGTYLGGELASRFAANNEALQLKSVAILYCGLSVVWACTYLAPTVGLAMGLMALGTIANGMANGPLFATIQTLVPSRMRAMSIALLFLFANLVGMGLGPLAAGMLSDALRPWAGEESLRYSLLLLCPGILWSAWHVWRAGEVVGRDLAAMDVTIRERV
jgi:MFS family permease